MARINSKSKGSKNERDICKWWKDWSGYDFSRVPSSGGLRWSRTTDTTGDIICSDKKHFLKFPFSIEAKSYNDINFEHVLLGNKSSKILSFWAQAISDAERGEKVPLLMMRYNGMRKSEYFVVMDSPIHDLLMLSSKGKIHSMAIVSKDYNMVIVLASEIINNVNYKDFYKKVRKHLIQK